MLEPDFSHVGPDAAEIGRAAFRARVGRGTAPLKARLLDQRVLAGVGNLLADETLWRARLSPRRPAGDLTPEELDVLRRALRAATRSAIRKGGVHTGDVHPPPEPRRPLPALRHRAGAGHRRRPDHLLVPGLPARLSRASGGRRRRGAAGRRRRGAPGATPARRRRAAAARHQPSAAPGVRRARQPSSAPASASASRAAARTASEASR